MTHALISKMSYGSFSDGQNAELVCFRNSSGTEVRITNLGLTIVNFFVMDRNGISRDIICGCDSAEDYFHQQAYLSSIVGRYANRIAHGKFKIGDQQYQLPLSLPPHTLHGGKSGFHRKLWRIRKAELIDQIPTAIFELIDEDGSEGWPGEQTTVITISLNDDNELKIDMQAQCTKDCHINLTHHAYFNLTGDINDDLSSHEFKLNTQLITEVDHEAIPTGEIVDISETALDFKTFKSPYEALNSEDDRVKRAGGVDHNFVYKTENTSQLMEMAQAQESNSGLRLTVYSTQPGMQFYTGQFMSGTPARGGKEYAAHGGFCFEPQHFADTPNKPKFPSTLIKAGEQYQQTMIFKVN